MSCGFPIDVQGRLRPCGKCQGCLRRRRRAWVGRMLAEAAELGSSSFLTLTYSDEKLPLVYHSETGEWIPTLVKSHARNWIQSVRRSATAVGLPRRFFMAGEYGTKTGRPHLHCILFGIGPTWQSRFEPLWEHGFQSWFDASPRAMAYVAKYCLKHGRDPELELRTSTPHCDEATCRVTVPPFRRMSRNPPIGAGLVRKVAASVSKPATVSGMLEQEKMLKGEVRFGKDVYPMDRTMRDRLDRELADNYALDSVTRDRMLRKESYEPTAREIENARRAHIRGWQRRQSRHKL